MVLKGKFSCGFLHLQNIKQFLTIEGTNSDMYQVEYGVPQWEILSTLLLLITINDLNKALKFTNALYMQAIEK